MIEGPAQLKKVAFAILTISWGFMFRWTYRIWELSDTDQNPWADLSSGPPGLLTSSTNHWSKYLPVTYPEVTPGLNSASGHGCTSNREGESLSFSSTQSFLKGRCEASSRFSAPAPRGLVSVSFDDSDSEGGDRDKMYRHTHFCPF